MLTRQDSNPNEQCQKLICYHYTTGQCYFFNTCKDNAKFYYSANISLLLLIKFSFFPVQILFLYNGLLLFCGCFLLFSFYFHSLISSFCSYFIYFYTMTFLRFILCSVVLLCGPLSFSANVFLDPTHASLSYEGRVLMSPSAAQFQYPGTSVSFSFVGSQVQARLKPRAGYYWVQIDSLPPYRLSTYSQGSSDSLFNLAPNLSKGLHQVKLMLISEGLFCSPTFYGFQLSAWAHPQPQAPPAPHTIEFIGNSITCGYGVDAPSTSPFADSTSNFAHSYAYLTAQSFEAGLMVVARSGIGAYRNYNDSVYGSLQPLPSFYSQTLITPSPAWNFSNFTPQIVCVNLETNDFSAGVYDVQLFAKAYSAFIDTLRSVYPKASLIMLSGCMLSGQRLQDCLSAIDSVVSVHRKAGDNAIYRFNFPTQTGSLGYGSDGHPSFLQQQHMATDLINFLRTTFPTWIPVASKP